MRFSDSALEESGFDITLIFNDYKFHVNPMLEVMMTPDFGRFSLPTWTEFLHKNDIVRIPHGDRNAAHFPESQLDRKFIAYPGLAHVRFRTHSCDSLRLMSVQVLIPAPVRMANSFFGTALCSEHR